MEAVSFSTLFHVVRREISKEDEGANFRTDVLSSHYTGQAGADLVPVYQVAAVKDGYASHVLERADHQVIVVANPADARVGMEAGDDRARTSHFSTPHGSKVALCGLRSGTIARLWCWLSFWHDEG